MAHMPPDEEQLAEMLVTLERIRNEVPVAVQEEFAAKLPTVPGTYMDKNGGSWRLEDTGNWYDEEGTTFDPMYNFVLGVMDIQ